MRRRVTCEEIRLGAIYMFGAKLDRAVVVALLKDRLAMKQLAAEQLVAHWAGTSLYREKGK